MTSGAKAPVAATRSFSPDFVRELEELFAWRRDVRRFRPDTVAEALVWRVIEACGSAPSVGLSEPWRLVRVATPERRRLVAENFISCNAAALAGQEDARKSTYAALKLAGLGEAPVHLAVFCDDATSQGAGLGAMTMPETRRYSVVCAVMQMWLAARSLGLGMGWVSILDPARVARELDVSANWSLIAYLCLGWPEEEHLDCELQRARWETRHRLRDRIFTR